MTVEQIVWLSFFVLLLIIESLTCALTTIWFAFGSLIALVLSFITDNVIVQIIAFSVASVLFILFLRPWALKRFNKRRAKTNIDALVGKTVRITEAVNSYENTGRGVLDGMEWAVRSLDNDVFFGVGDQVCVVRLDGVKLIVKEKE